MPWNRAGWQEGPLSSQPESAIRSPQTFTAAQAWASSPFLPLAAPWPPSLPPIFLGQGPCVQPTWDVPAHTRCSTVVHQGTLFIPNRVSIGAMNYLVGLPKAGSLPVFPSLLSEKGLGVTALRVGEQPDSGDLGKHHGTATQQLLLQEISQHRDKPKQTLRGSHFSTWGLFSLPPSPGPPGSGDTGVIPGRL